MLIALTGGIGSGKTTVAARWVELGAREIDADLLAREVVEPSTEGLAEIVERFGKEILLADGSLDRGALAKVAFADDQSRKDLEAILHPRIQRLAAERVKGLGGVIVYTIPLLAETSSKLEFDRVVTVSCDEAVRIDRLVTLRGMSKEEAMGRITAQASDAEREARADTVIDSNCPMDELISRADEVFATFS
ncbi:MAG: dephospho-CoA kinase [Candidatus Aquiluna sp. XM-24bin5]|nr:MAG: dephospho-CoA kinase [Candidatus Aquiluna sp. XM-24bin5]